MLFSSRRTFLKASAALAAGMTFPRMPGMAQSGNNLVVLSGLDAATLDPHRTGAAFGMITMARNFYDPLISVEGTPPRLVPRLATSWNMSEDGTEYTFSLDPSARFHDGTPVTAGAVRYSFERILRTPESNRWAIEGVVTPEGITAVDDKTVRIKLTTPFGPFLQVLPLLWIVNPAPIEANKGADDGATWLRTNVAGSGPFTIARFEPGNLVHLQRVAAGWRQGGGNLDNVLWRITREPATQRQLLAQGQGHMALGLTPEDMTALKDSAGVTLLAQRESRGFHLKMNTKHGPLTDINLRRAICCAVDYKAMLDVLGPEYSDPMTGPFPSEQADFPRSVAPWTQNLARAKEYLAQSATPNGGIKLTTVYLTGYEEMRQWSLILLDALRQLNIELDISSATFPDMVSQTKTPETTPDFRHGYTSQPYYDLDPLAYREYHSSINGSFSNPTYGNPRADELARQGRFEANPEVRAKLYAEFQDVVVADAPAVYGVWLKRRIAMRSNVSGYEYCPVLNGGAPEFFPLSLG